MSKRIGILTGGGDAPGLNAVIRAVVKYGVGRLGWEIVGIEDSFNGLLEDAIRIHHLTPASCKGLLQRGGTVLGTTNKGDPFAWVEGGKVVDRTQRLAERVRDLGMEGLIVIGGDGTQAIGHRLMKETGVPVVGVPKTIDNDLRATDQTFGFQSAVDVATEALDRLHTTAEAHDRVLILEVMGRDAGHIALHAGIAGGADVILLPELPYDASRVAAKIRRRQLIKRHFSLIVVAEGAVPAEVAERCESLAERWTWLRAHGGAGAALGHKLPELVQAEIRTVVLGHLQRGGSPVPFDRVLATRFGVKAVELVAEGRWGQMVCYKGGSVTSIHLDEVTGGIRGVDTEGELCQVARRVGVELGQPL